MKRIPLHGKYGEGKFALVDDADFDYLNSFTWIVTADGYPRRGHNATRMHREIADAQKGEYVDHQNGNPLDNRRSNLRICTNAENARNARKHRRACSSPFKGVYCLTQNRGRTKWRSQLMVNYQKVNLGNYETAEEAAYVYDQAAMQLFGGFARTNLL